MNITKEHQIMVMQVCEIINTLFIIIMEPQSQSILNKVLIAGSGSNCLLLTGSTEDLIGFCPVDISIYRFIKCRIGGMFGVAINSKKQSLVWGMLGEEAIMIPRLLKIEHSIKDVSCGWNHSLLVSQDGLLFGFGCNKFNQLTSEKKTFYSEPIEIAADWIPEKVCCGFRQTYVLSTDNKLHGRGQNKNAQLSENASVDQNGWNLVGVNEHKICKIGCGKRFVVLLNQLGELWGCGNNQYKVFKESEVSVKQLSLIYKEVSDFSTGWNNLTISTKQGKVLSFGINSLGQLGHSTDTNQATFPNYNHLTNIRLTSGTEFTFCLADQGLFAWGWNEHNNITSEKIEIVDTPLAIPYKACEVITYGAVTILINH